MTACLTCGGFSGLHDDYAHGTGDYAGDVYGIDAPDLCGACGGTGYVEDYDYLRPDVPCHECDGWGVS